nr:MAG TPA: hypothetical protein [Caudoviricetes sp.]
MLVYYFPEQYDKTHSRQMILSNAHTQPLYRHRHSRCL